MISEVRAMTAAGAMPLTAVSAAALAPPYGVTGSGGLRLVVAGRDAGENRVA